MFKQATFWITFVARLVTVAAVLGSLVACSQFRQLNADLKKLDKSYAEFSVSITSVAREDIALGVFAFRDADGVELERTRLISTQRDFVITTAKAPMYFFAFADENGNLRFDKGEPAGWGNNHSRVVPLTGEATPVMMKLTRLEFGSQEIPEMLPRINLESLNRLQNIQFSNGTVTPIESKVFSPERAREGLWTPLAALKRGDTGIHFTEPYDPKRTPILFVHGINGSPSEFRFLIRNLDHDRYQAWVYYYPSGFPLSSIADSLVDSLTALTVKHHFTQLHIIAHSMGGLVTRKALNLCINYNKCEGVLSYTTISTPWAGHRRAQAGVDLAPGVVPAWVDIAPGSAFLETLFEEKLPSEFPHYLLFGYKGRGITRADNYNDGVVTIASQLRREAQLSASVVRGYHAGHAAILEDPDLQIDLNSLIESIPVRRRKQ